MNFILTDEGHIDKFLGIDINHLDKNKFEITQPFLIEIIANLLVLLFKYTSLTTVQINQLEQWLDLYISTMTVTLIVEC